ncbi:RNA-directed DNA polymerase [Phytophthora megakarya]|uniref:RNA-directed DNA polymerase n=1 Tax=Phytophthora megakarya TaxID=4795 RepID=A0A225UKW5_9STRA|nr:RNA-directed DNA polymerase [Phytophthora megakarya]
MSIPSYNKLVGPLSSFIEKVYTAGGGRKKSNVRGVQPANIGWGAEEEQCLEACRVALENALQLAHPDPKKRLCVFADASDLHWGAAITQVPREHLNRDFTEQHHEPLMMIRGTFSGSAKCWAIVEKEAYAIMETCKRADYLVQRADGFLVFTDHRNRRFIFAPTTVLASVPKYTADKLHRWSLILMGFRYEIHDISGDSNVWADLLSRWGSFFTTVFAIRHTVFPVSHQLDSTFLWPTTGKIRAIQRERRPPPGVNRDTLSAWCDEGFGCPTQLPTYNYEFASSGISAWRGTAQWKLR